MTARLPVFLDGDTVRGRITMSAAIEAVRAAFVSMGAGDFEVPQRLALDDGRILVMVASRAGTHDCAVKIISIDPHRQPLATVSGSVVWMDGHSGSMILSADAESITALRTGAASGVATDVLAEPDASRLAIIGAGAQAADQVRAVCAVRPITDIAVHSRTPASAQAFADRLRLELPSVRVDVRASAGEAVAEAHVVCCATSATEPLFRTADLRADVHVNAIGSYRTDMCELPLDLLTDAHIVAVDSVEAVCTEAGEVHAALRTHAIERADLVTLSELLTNPVPRKGRTVFKSVGLAVQDWAIADLLARDAAGQN